jgi:hypothetical protein
MNSVMKKLIATGMALTVALGAIGTVAVTNSSFTQAAPSEVKVENKSTDDILTPSNHALLMIDHQPQMAFATNSHDMTLVRNNPLC